MESILMAFGIPASHRDTIGIENLHNHAEFWVSENEIRISEISGDIKQNNR